MVFKIQISDIFNIAAPFFKKTNDHFSKNPKLSKQERKQQGMHALLHLFHHGFLARMEQFLTYPE